jgi:glycosyltransferase involved in cell wall biosynthesis
MNKLVSVIMPCYNCSNTIVETLQSVSSQTYKNIEIIIVNDGSLDNSEEVILISSLPMNYRPLNTLIK